LKYKIGDIVIDKLSGKELIICSYFNAGVSPGGIGYFCRYLNEISGKYEFCNFNEVEIKIGGNK
jgi:hypothetical protein